MSKRRCLRCQTVYSGEARFCPRDGSPLVDVAGGTTKSAPAAPRERTIERGVVKPQASAPRPDRAGTLTDEVLDSRYEILRKLGEGGMSYVYEARQAGSGETIAVKVLSPKLSADKTAVERLRREAGLAMRLDHPNVCPILRLGETEDGLIYLVMPFLRGELLSDRETRVGPMPIDVGVDLLIQMCEGLHHAHGFHIVHRDLKPENVMLEPNKDGSERAVIMDFGLAKDKRTLPGMQKLTATGVILGTPEFMSPEQVRGKPLDARSDVYSLGILAFEMLTGKLPFEGRNPQEMMIARLRGSPMPLEQYRPDLPPKLIKVLTRAMETAPEKRFETAQEFGEAVAQAVKGGLLDRFKKRPQ